LRRNRGAELGQRGKRITENRRDRKMRKEEFEVIGKPSPLYQTNIELAPVTNNNRRTSPCPDSGKFMS
jgi:hypothetical protein